MNPKLKKCSMHEAEPEFEPRFLTPEYFPAHHYDIMPTGVCACACLHAHTRTYIYTHSLSYVTLYFVG